MDFTSSRYRGETRSGYCRNIGAIFVSRERRGWSLLSRFERLRFGPDKSMRQQRRRRQRSRRRRKWQWRGIATEDCESTLKIKTELPLFIHFRSWRLFILLTLVSNCHFLCQFESPHYFVVYLVPDFSIDYFVILFFFFLLQVSHRKVPNKVFKYKLKVYCKKNNKVPRKKYETCEKTKGTEMNGKRKRGN